MDLIRRIPVFDVFGTLENEKETKKQKEWNGLNMSYAGFFRVNKSLTMYNSRLVVLNLSHNRIQSIDPAVFLSLSKLLTTLDLSFNNLSIIPLEVGHMSRLSVLRLNNNLIRELPAESGRLVGTLKTLTLKDNPISMPPLDIMIQGLETTLRFLRDRILAPQLPPRRKWAALTHEMIAPKTHTVICFNVLAERYCTEKMYPYAPSWAIGWENHRGPLIMSELLSHDADIICLQEVEGDKYETLFNPELNAAGYDGVFKQKGRAQTMEGEEKRKVDGCAIFYRRTKYQLIHLHEMDFTQIALARDTEFMSVDQDSLSRLMRTDNIAIATVLREKHNPQSTFIVSNTHLHWNPELCDVKLLQAQFLMEQVESLYKGNSAVCVCGDFNSEPSSAVYQLITTGYVTPDHKDLQGSKFGKYGEAGFRHGLKLTSCMHAPYTNFTGTYCGTLDYIFVENSHLKPLAYLQVHSKDVVQREVARPGVYAPSDHFSLVCKVGVV